MNSAQEVAIFSSVPTVLVSAGAGSGKTRVLTERYLRLLLEEKLNVEQILTLTFTRKAAQEMRARISGQLDAKGLVHQRRELSRAPIGTIHSFCERLLREHALQAGVDPHFRLLDEPEARTMQEQALDAVFEDVWSGGQREREAIGRLLLDVSQEIMRKHLIDIYGQARSCGLPISDIFYTHNVDTRPPARSLAAAIEELLAVEPTSEKWREAIIAASQAYVEFRPLLDAGEFSWQDYARAEELKKPLTPTGGPRGIGPEARRQVMEAWEAWSAALLDHFVSPYLSAFCILLRRFDHTYSEAKNALGLLDFSDLLLLSREVLRDEEGGASKHYRARFRQVMVDEFQDTNPLQFSVISAVRGAGDIFMVGDVKQSIYRFNGSDIGVFLDQERDISALGETGLRVAMSTNYRTRGEVLGVVNSVFSRLWESDSAFEYEALEAGAEFITKDSPSVEFAFWTGETGENTADLRDREGAWIARRILQLTGQIGDDPLMVSARNEEEKLVARPATFGDVMLLFRASPDIPRYEAALREAGIDYYVVSGRGYYDSREVQDIVHFLRVVANPLDDFAMAVTLRSPMGAVSDDGLYWLARDWSEWREGEEFPAQSNPPGKFGVIWENIGRVDSLPALSEADRAAIEQFSRVLCLLQREAPAGQPLDLIDMMLTETHFAEILLASEDGEQRYANVKKLREVASTFQRRGIFDLTDFERYLTALKEIAPREASAPLDVEGGNVVRLMTIHAAKGLEAPVVFLADCGRGGNAGNQDFFLLGADGRLVGKLPPQDEGEWQKPASFEEVRAENAQAEAREAERLLYVGMTRAREHLICSGAAKKRGETYAKILMGTLGVTPVDEDQDAVIDGQMVRVWSQESLRITEGFATPEVAPTLWDRFSGQIIAGVPLPLVTDGDEINRFEGLLNRLRPLPPSRSAGPLRIGVNKAICYAKCPRRFWFQYVLCREGGAVISLTPSIQPESEREELLARADGTAFGTLFHAIMQFADFHAPLEGQVDGLIAGLAGQFAASATPGVRESLADCLRWWESRPLFSALREADNTYRELRFLAREGRVFMPGIIDVMARSGEEILLVDYKTGHPSADHARQVWLYALGVRHTVGITPGKVALVYVGDHREVREYAVTAGMLEQAREIIARAGEGIRDERFAPIPGRQCATCPYQVPCPAAILPEQMELLV